jgi:predicted ATPase
MKAIHQGQEEASDGHGQIVSVVGEPGVGKSRLFYEFLHSHRVENWLVLENDSVSYGKARPWLPVTDLLKGYFGVDDDDEARLVSERVAGKLVMLGEALKPAMSPLLALLGVPVDDGDWNTLDAEQRHRRTVDAVKAVLLRESQVQPLILVFEDLHWVDENSQALLDSLVESLPTNRLLLLVNYRPEYEHAWGGRTYYTQLRIDPLGQDGAEAMLASLLGSDPRLDGLNRMLVERTEGNPLFAEESVRALVESGALTGERGAYRLTRNVDRLDIPVTVQNILAARIDRLSPEAKHVLQCAAVVGHYVQYLVLQSVAELAEGDLRAHLAELQGAEYLYEARLFPELEYTFKHALTHEVAYGSILQDRRRELHLRSGEAIERLYPNRPNRWYIVTHHYFQAEAWQKVAKLSIAWSEFG